MEKLLVGLDIGTNSIGWCAADENSQIVKKNGKSLWGYLGFDEAHDASERRGYRCQRRRLRRRKQRIELLREIFSDEISKVDDSFYFRLDNSFYVKDDRFDNEGKLKTFNYTFFNDKNFTDKQYFDKFPTIFHLRKYLIDTSEKADIRLIYLALHHMIKYRGNFLNNSKEFRVFDQEEIKQYFRLLNNCLEQLSTQDEDNERKDKFKILDYDDSKFVLLKNLVENVSGIKRMKDEFGKILNSEKNKFNNDVVISLMVGGEVSIKKKIYTGPDEGVNDELIGKSLCVKSDEYEQTIDELVSSEMINDDMCQVLMLCKAIFDYFLVGKLLGKNKWLSHAMVSRYEEHKRQLAELKKYVRNSCPEKYNKIFRLVDLDKVGRKAKTNNYPAYVGLNSQNGKCERFAHYASREDFYKFLNQELSLEKSEDEFCNEVLKYMGKNEYLLRQNSNENGVFPYQLHKMEMKKILENQSKYYPFLNDMSDGLSNIEKIISILEFKIPYYIGPLVKNNASEEMKKFAWVVRKDEVIRPWNFDKIVNKAESAKNFIQRMLTKCTYIKDSYCLPKDSLLFSYYNTLNNLNKFIVNGCYLDYTQKMELINNLFRKKRKVTKKDIREYFVSKYGESDIKLSEKGGVDSFNERYDINFSLSSYVDFAGIFGSDFDKDLQKKELVEKIILDIVIFEDKSILEERLRTEYAITDATIIKKIKMLNYKKYGAFSRELLDGIKTQVTSNKTGEVEQKSIIQIMEETNLSFMEVINDSNYDFMGKIDEYNYKNGVILNETIDDYVDNLGFVSPIMKRPLIQAYKICKEIEKIVGHRIDEYYVECTRTNKETKGKQGMKLSRQNQILDFLNDVKKEIKSSDADGIQIDKLIEKANAMSTESFRSDKYYLYFTQLGKCMYTGEKIDFDELSNDRKYDIDHIYPQSLIKDDSLSNRVLVKTSANEEKKDIYPIPRNMLWRDKGGYKTAEKYYEFLKESKLISGEKYKRLIKRDLTENDMESFVNRQLVTTNQAVKCFIDAIRNIKTDSKNDEGFSPKIVYSKAENVSDFRKKYDILKSRNANNFHHAHDAYLNIVVGRTIDVYFEYYRQKYKSKNWYNQMHENNITTNVMKIFDPNKGKANITTAQGYNVWAYDDSINRVKNNIWNRYDIFSTERTFVSNCMFDKATIYPKGVGNIGVKSNGLLQHVEKYGGLKQYRFGSYCLICVNGKKGKEYIIEAIPGIYKDFPNRWLDESYHNGYTVIIPVVKINTVFESGKLKYCITGKDGNSYVIKNRNERFFNYEQIKCIRKCEKLYDQINGKTTGCESIEEIGQSRFKDKETIIISSSNKERTKEITLSEGELKNFYNSYIDLLSKPVYNFTQSKNIQDELVKNKEKFDSLSIYGKCVTIMKLLDYLKCNERKTVDLSLIGGKEKCGVLTTNKKLKNCKIVYESITGFYRKVVFDTDNVRE